MDGGDADAVARARAGDSEAFRTLVERHARSVFGLAYRMTGNEHDAEDVVQETFLRAYRRLPQFEGRADFGSWLYRIAANCSYDLLRGRARREEHAVPEQPDGSDTLHALRSSDPPPDRLVWSGEVRQKVRSAMTKMSALERSAFALRHFQGMSIREISQVLDLDTSATKHSIFRAVKKLRQALQPVVGS